MQRVSPCSASPSLWVLHGYTVLFYFFFFNDTAPPEIYPLPLHAALPIPRFFWISCAGSATRTPIPRTPMRVATDRSEEHTSELQSRLHLVCRLLLEKKKKTDRKASTH